jgi:hypothetical protein
MFLLDTNSDGFAARCKSNRRGTIRVVLASLVHVIVAHGLIMHALRTLETFLFGIFLNAYD